MTPQHLRLVLSDVVERNARRTVTTTHIVCRTQLPAGMAWGVYRRDTLDDWTTPVFPSRVEAELYALTGAAT